AMTQVLYWTQRAPILRMMHFDFAVYIPEFDARAAASQFTAQIVSHKTMVVHVQSEIVVNSPRDGAGLNHCLRVRRNRKLNRAVHRVQLHRGSRELIKPCLQMTVDGR